MNVSFDFDGTLSRYELQEYAINLMDKDINVFILTSRYDEAHKHLYKANPQNEDLFEVADRLNIPRQNIIFTNMKSKSDVFVNTKIIWHMDDDRTECDLINKLYSLNLHHTIAIPVDGSHELDDVIKVGDFIVDLMLQKDAKNN